MCRFYTWRAALFLLPKSTDAWLRSTGLNLKHWTDRQPALFCPTVELYISTVHQRHQTSDLDYILFTVHDMIITDSRHCTSCIWRGSISETKISYLFTVPDMIITDSRHCTSCIWRKHLWNQKIIEKGHMHINRFFLVFIMLFISNYILVSS